MADTLRQLVERCEADPAAVAAARAKGDALADLGEDDDPALALRWRIAVLRSVLSDPPDADAVREYYGELVDRYRDDKPALAQLRDIGAEIKRRESSGELASTMVARSDRRKR